MNWKVELTRDEVNKALVEWAEWRFARSVGSVRVDVSEGSLDPREPSLPHVSRATIEFAPEEVERG